MMSLTTAAAATATTMAHMTIGGSFSRSFFCVALLLFRCKLSYILTQAGVCNFIIYLFFVLFFVIAAAHCSNHFRCLLREHLLLMHVTSNNARKNTQPFILLLSFQSGFFLWKWKMKGKNSQLNGFFHFSRSLSLSLFGLFVHPFNLWQPNSNNIYILCRLRECIAH